MSHRSKEREAVRWFVWLVFAMSVGFSLGGYIRARTTKLSHDHVVASSVFADFTDAGYPELPVVVENKHQEDYGY